MVKGGRDGDRWGYGEVRMGKRWGWSEMWVWPWGDNDDVGCGYVEVKVETSPCVQVGRVPFQVTSGLQVRDGLPLSTYPSSQLKVTEVFTVPDPSMRRWMSPELKEQLAERR